MVVHHAAERTAHLGRAVKAADAGPDKARRQYTPPTGLDWPTMPQSIPPRPFTRPAVLATTLAAVLFWVLILAVLALDTYGGDMRGLLCLGQFRHAAALADVPRAGPAGYDGQFYGTLAIDPWLRDRDTPRLLDNAHYRATRVGLPLLAWVVALGNAGGAIYAYQILGWLLALLAVYLAAVWLAADGSSPAWALLLAPSAGLAVSMTRCAPDAAALALMLAALWFHRRRRPGGAAAALAAAVLVRETSLLAAVAIAFAETRERRYRAAALALAAPAATYVAWQLYLAARLGHTSSRGLGLLTWPLAWLPRKLAALLAGEVGDPTLEALGLVALLAACAALVPVVRSLPRWTASHALYALFAVLGLSLSYTVLVEVYAYGRAIVALPFLALLLASGETRRWRRAVFTAVTVAFCLAGWPVVSYYLRPATMARAIAVLHAGPAVPRAMQPTLPASGSTPAPPPAEPAGAPATSTFYLLPIANVPGFDGARWRSEVDLRNDSATEASVTVELVRAGIPGKATAMALTLGPRAHAYYGDALRDMFGVTGVGALRVTPARGAVAGWCRTYVAARTGRPAPLPGIVAESAFSEAAAARLDGLAQHPSSRGGVHTNLGLLSLSPFPTTLEISLSDGAGAVMKEMRVGLAAYELKQLNDVYASAAPDVIDGGAALLRMATPGGRFLAYAAVVSGGPVAVRYVLPAAAGAAAARPRRAGAAAAPPATPAAPPSSTASPADGSARRSPSPPS